MEKQRNQERLPEYPNARLLPSAKTQPVSKQRLLRRFPRETKQTMHLMYYLDDQGNRVYSLKARRSTSTTMGLGLTHILNACRTHRHPALLLAEIHPGGRPDTVGPPW